MKSYLNDEVPSTIIVDREQAIKQAIMESQETRDLVLYSLVVEVIEEYYAIVKQL